MVIVARSFINVIGNLTVVIWLISKSCAYLHHKLISEYENQVFWSSNHYFHKLFHDSRTMNEIRIVSNWCRTKMNK